MKNKILLGLTAISTTAVTSCTESNTNIEKPNIVIVYADDMGYGDMSCQNPNSKIQTPNIDRLASEGVRFTDGHSSCSVSSPSRYALLSGNYHWRRMTEIVGAYGDEEFVDNEMTMPRMLKSVGYYTAMVGKWHLGWDWSSVLTPEARERIGTDHMSTRDKTAKKIKYRLEDFDWSQPFKGGPVSIGFDYYYGDGTINFPPYCWIENETVAVAPSFYVEELNHKPLEAGGKLRPGVAARDWHPDMVLPRIKEKALEVINNQKGDKPFFLYLALSAPHAPIIPNEEFRGKSDAGFYGDFVIQCDDILASVEAALKSNGLEENTIVIFSSDNGAESYAYERMERFDHNSTESLRGVKRDLYEGGHRVPFIVKWPNKIKAGTVSDELVSQIDLMATFAELTGFTLDSGAARDSYSLLPLLLAETSDSPRTTHIHHFNKDTYAIRKGDWVYVDNHSGYMSPSPDWYNEKYNYSVAEKGEKEYELYNINDDLAEHNDYATKHPEKVSEMQKLLHQQLNSERTN